MFKKLLSLLAQIFQEASIPYMVIGGQAVLVHGEPRMTKDIDITMGVNTDRLNDVCECARKAGLKILPENPESFVSETMVLPCLAPESGIRVDLTFSFSDYEKEAIELAVTVKMEDTDVKFINAENLVIHKIIASRPRDLEDVRAVVLKNKNIDTEYIISKLDLFSASLDTDFSETFKNMLKDLI